MEIGIIITWIVFCFVAGSVGEKRKIGFAKTFLLSLLLSPLIGLIIAFNSDKKTDVIYASPAMTKLINEGDKLVIEKKHDEAIQKFSLALPFSDKSPLTKFKLAKLYSIKKDFENSFKYLKLSIQDGFGDFEQINHDIDLSFLRNTDEFKEFSANGYKNLMIKPETERTPSRIDELERLSNLFEKGFLTQDEFEVQKQKLLTNN